MLTIIKTSIYSFILFFFIIISGNYVAYGNNLKLENLNYDQENETLTFDISWENAWYVNDDFRDAVWVFAKYKASNGSNWNHLDWTGAVISGGDFTFNNEAVGFRIDHVNTAPDQFDVTSTTVTVQNLKILSPIGGVEVLNPSIQIFGLEMVYIPEGDFYAGDGNGLVGFTENFSTYEPALIQNGTSEYNWLRLGVGYTEDLASIPYDNGWDEFYIMKYEFTQGMYRDFLNTSTVVQQQYLTHHNIQNATEYEPNAMLPGQVGGLVGYNASDFNAIKGPDELGDIPITYFMDLNENDVPNEDDDGASRVCTYLLPSMLIALLDWSALRPMTELQYEKASRGFEFPIANEYSWGTNDYTIIGNAQIKSLIINPGTPQEASPVSGEGLVNWNEIPLRVGFAANDTTNRLTSSSSYFGVQNLSDNITELTIGIGSSEDLSSLNNAIGVLSDGDFTILTEQMKEIPILYRGGGIVNGSLVSVSDNSGLRITLGTTEDQLPNVSNLISLGGRGVR